MLTFIDITGTVGSEHARDMHRAAKAYRAGRVGRPEHSAFRDFLARTQLGPVDNYRSR
jgi:hypothetical protein